MLKRFSALVLGFFLLATGFGVFKINHFYDTSAEKIQYTFSKAECVMEQNSRRILYSWKGDETLPMASTTKILTAITVLDQCKNLQEELCIPAEAEGIEGSSVYLKQGDVYTIEDLLYGLMLRSGNDCATALALHFGGSIAHFSTMMNIVAQKAGAVNSRFSNPHGLPCDGHYTTARDLSYITCYAMENPIFRQIVSTQYYRIRNWKNKNKMLSNYDGAIGVKTGYTKQAGRCLVSAATKNGMTLVCTVLNCPTMYERSAKLLDDAFSAYHYATVLPSNEPLKITDGRKEWYGCARQDFRYPLLEEEKHLLQIKTHAKSKNCSQKDDQIVGEFEIYLAKQLLFSGNLYKL